MLQWLNRRIAGTVWHWLFRIRNLFVCIILSASTSLMVWYVTSIAQDPLMWLFLSFPLLYGSPFCSKSMMPLEQVTLRVDKTVEKASSWLGFCVWGCHQTLSGMSRKSLQLTWFLCMRMPSNIVRKVLRKPSADLVSIYEDVIKHCQECLSCQQAKWSVPIDRCLQWVSLQFLL